jgi:hypothetical protein
MFGSDVPSVDVTGRSNRIGAADTFDGMIYIPVMTTVEDIEKAIATLEPGEFDRLRAWFEEFQAMRFDERIERDAKSGKLDRIADQAVSNHREGRSREL